MKQAIRFLGLTMARDEQSIENGELSQCGNVELHDGTLRPSLLTGTAIAGGAAFGGTLLYVHKTQTYTHYIGVDANGYLFHARDLQPGEQNYPGYYSQQFGHGNQSAQGLISITSIGNTLVALYDTGLHYFLFKETAYYYLGQKPPFAQLQFSLKKENWWDTGNHPQEIIEFSTDIWQESEGVYTITEGVRTQLTETVLGNVNKTISEVTEKGLFHAPFLVRYCYTLYDNSQIWHSVPVLLFPMLRHPVNVIADFGVAQHNILTTWVNMLSCKLQWKCLNDMTDIGDWTDIVKSLDVYITTQFDRIDTSKRIEEIVTTGTYLIGNECLHDGSFTIKIEDGDLGYSANTNIKCFALPEQDEDVFMKKIRDASEYFLLTSIKPQAASFSSSFADLDYSSTVLQAITTQKQLTDDYHSHYYLTGADDGQHSYIYNSRLHLFGMSETIAHPQRIDLYWPYCTSVTGNYGDGRVITVTAGRVEVETSNGTRVFPLAVGTTDKQEVAMQWLMTAYLLFPDSQAVKLTIEGVYPGTGGDVTVTKQMQLDPAALLEGGVRMANGWEDVTLPAASNAAVLTLNKIYVSEVSNPFYFPLEGRQTVGVGKVLGLATVTTALSQGQYGMHDLIVFCSDGIWTLSVSSKGTYNQVHPLSREVCANAQSICQLDQSVLFATEKGLSRLAESSVASVSNMLDGPMIKATTLPGMTGQTGFFADDGAYEDGEIDALLNFDTHPLTFFQTSSPLYDFAGKRVIMLPASRPTSGSFPVYVLSLSDMSWSTMLFPEIVTAKNVYPNAFVQKADKSLLCLDKAYDNGSLPSAGSRTSAIVITRTLTFSTLMQIVKGFEQIHNMTSSPVLFLYGSNDTVTWRHLGHSSRLHADDLPGYTCRFFRLAVYMQLRVSERYSSVLLNVMEQYKKL